MSDVFASSGFGPEFGGYAMETTGRYDSGEDGASADSSACWLPAQATQEDIERREQWERIRIQIAEWGGSTGG